MADRFPLILNTSANQIQEIASGDTLDLTGNNISNAGVITATSFSGPIIAGAGTSNITAGIITAVTFKGDGDFVELDVDGHTNLDNVTITGVSTFAGAIDLNSDIDVDGHTNLDNVNIAGVTTGTTINATTFVGALTGNATSSDTVDVTSDGSAPGTSYPIFVDNHGSGKTVRLDSGLSYVPATNVLTAGTFSGSGASLTGITNANISNSAAIAFSKLATGALPAGITVSGSNITAGAIHDSDVNASANIAGTKISPNFGSQNIVSTGYVSVKDLYLTDDNPTVYFTDSNNTDYIIEVNGGIWKVRDTSNSADRLVINSDGHVDIAGNLDCAAGIDVTGNATVSGNLSVGGVLTYEDVTNVDSVGIVTARNGIKVLAGGADVAGVVTATGGVFVPDNNQIQLGNAAGSADLRIYHQSSNNHSYISETGSGSLIVLADDFYVQDTSTNTMISAKEGAESNLHFNGGTPKLSTTNTGISVTGRADISTGLAVGTSGVQSSNVVSIKGAVSNQLNIADSSNNSWGLLLTQSQASGGYHATTNSGVGKPCAIVNVNADALHFGTTNTLRWTIDNTGHFYPGGNGHLDIGKSGSQVKTIFATGAVVTGVVTATSFSGDGSNLTGVLVGITTEQVTPSSNVATLNLAKDDHKIVASGTYTIDVSGGTEASSHTLRIENSGTANVGFSTFFKFPSGGTPSLPTASGAISLVSFQVHKVGSVGIATVLLAGASVNFS